MYSVRLLISEKLIFYLCVGVASPYTLTPPKDAYTSRSDPRGWVNHKSNSLMYNNLYGQPKIESLCRALSNTERPHVQTRTDTAERQRRKRYMSYGSYMNYWG